jgi:hypothetical protein
VALQGVSGSTATVFIRWPYSPKTFDRVLRIYNENEMSQTAVCGLTIIDYPQPQLINYYNWNRILRKLSSGIT